MEDLGRRHRVQHPDVGEDVGGGAAPAEVAQHEVAAVAREALVDLEQDARPRAVDLVDPVQVEDHAGDRGLVHGGVDPLGEVLGSEAEL